MSAVTGSMWPSPGHQKQARRPAATSASPTRLPLSLACRPASAAQGLNASCLNRPEPLPACLVRTLAGAAMPVGVLDPRRVRVLRLVKGRKAKTERLDAGVIARSALIMTDVARPAPPPAGRDDRRREDPSQADLRAHPPRQPEGDHPAHQLGARPHRGDDRDAHQYRA